MQRTAPFTTFIATLRWAVAITMLGGLLMGNMGSQAHLLAQDDYWTRQRQKEDKTQAPRLDNTASGVNATFS